MLQGTFKGIGLLTSPSKIHITQDIINGVVEQSFRQIQIHVT